MRLVPLTATPNQEITCTLDNVRYVLRFVSLPGVMGVSVQADDVPLVTSSPVLAGEMLLPYEYREAGGNFILQTLDGALPDWSEFGVTQQLYYLDAAELGAIRG